jgi:hypothetical protein
MFTRREFVIKSASLAGSLPMSKLAAALITGQLKAIGIRSFDVKPEEAAETFHALEAIGYREMEGTYADIAAAWPAVQATSLKKVSVYIEGTLTAPGKEDELSRTFEQVKKWGFAYASCSYRQPSEGTGVDKYRIYADRVNLAGEKCRAAGLGPFLYHNQIYDFAPRDGTTGYQVLTDRLDKKLCALEMDVYWVSLAGYNPAEFLSKYSGRVKIIHMKDKPAGLQPMFDHVPAPGNYLDVGSGSLDWPAILRAAASAGVEHYIVEPDAKSASYMVEHGRNSFDYLSKLRF